MEREYPCSRLYLYTAASYTTIGIGERHTGQACVLGSLMIAILETTREIHGTRGYRQFKGGAPA
jgi:hypothetical protein